MSLNQIAYLIGDARWREKSARDKGLTKLADDWAQIAENYKRMAAR